MLYENKHSVNGLCKLSIFQAVLCPMKPARFSIKNDMSELFIGERDSHRLGMTVHRLHIIGIRASLPGAKPESEKK